ADLRRGARHPRRPARRGCRRRRPAAPPAQARGVTAAVRGTTCPGGRTRFRMGPTPRCHRRHPMRFIDLSMPAARIATWLAHAAAGTALAAAVFACCAVAQEAPETEPDLPAYLEPDDDP